MGTQGEYNVVLGRMGKWATFLWEDGSKRIDYTHMHLLNGDDCGTSAGPRRTDVFFECPVEVGSYGGTGFVPATQTQTKNALDATFAMDGNAKTRQGCGPSCEWIGDLGTVSTINKIDIDWEACQCKQDGAALIEVSVDKERWMLFAKIGGFHVWGGNSKRIFEGSASGRYVRI